uniref:Thymidine phosphorylase n=1 Tax=candidate division WOR-3 bacterium TaxID=2052148 RepID=A0A7V3V0C4_UNCW3
MDFLSLLARKQQRGRLKIEEIEWLINAYTRGEIPDYQMSAWLMAVYLRGLDKSETVALTRAMMNSGTVLDLSSIPGPKIDKHSTGGVGDKVSLMLAPLVAACGVVVPMISGRSLGHTGGTLDKLESIPGFRTNLTEAEFIAALKKIGVAMVGQTEQICPADRKIYALRDVTNTVASIPLIAASIMSKKLAEGIDGLVLDVKTGTGAFMTTRRQARKLARLMIDIGTALGKRVVALITSMAQPLGRTVGNALEVREAIDTLKGRGPADLLEITLTLGAEMLMLAEIVTNRQQARRLLLRALEKGQGLEKFRQIIETQGGNPAVIDNPELLPRAKYVKEVYATGSGYIRSINALQVGKLGLELGLGRKKLDDRIDTAAGFVFLKKVGEPVRNGEPIVQVHSNSQLLGEQVGAELAKAFAYSDRKLEPEELILEKLIRASEEPTPSVKRKRRVQRSRSGAI